MLRSASSPFIDLWRKLTAGRKGWLSADATVYSADWRQEGRVGWWQISYSYPIADTFFSGEFRQYRNDGEDHLKSGDTVEIRYDPANPDRSHVKDCRD